MTRYRLAAFAFAIATWSCTRIGPQPSSATAPDAASRLATLDSQATEGRVILWRIIDCLENTRRESSDGLYPATHRCGGQGGGWSVGYAREADGRGYRLLASRASGDRSVHLFAEGPTQGDEFSGLVHLAADTAGRDAPVTGSVVPYLMWMRWCLELGHTSRESGNAGYPLALVEVKERAPGCLPPPVFKFSASSNVVRVTAAGMSYYVEYKPESYGESLSEPYDDEPDEESAGSSGGERSRLIMEWTETQAYELQAYPVNPGASGVRSYRFRGPDQGLYGTVPKLDSGGVSTDARTVPECEVVRGLRCGPPSDAMTGGMSLDSLLGLPRRY